MRGAPSDFARVELRRRLALSFRAFIGTGALLLVAGLLGCDNEDELAIKCLDGDTGMCQRLCAAGRRGKGGCVTLATSLLDTDRPRARAILLDACDAHHLEACEHAFDALDPLKDAADRETRRELLTRICEGTEPVPAPPADAGRKPPPRWPREPCQRAAGLWLLDDPNKGGALLRRFCGTKPPAEAAECFEDARSIAGALGQSAAGCRAGRVAACARFIDGFFQLVPYEPEPVPAAPWDSVASFGYSEPKPKYVIRSRWPGVFFRPVTLAAGEACAARGLDDEALWPSKRDAWNHHGWAVYDYDLEDVPKLRCGYRSACSRLGFHRQGLYDRLAPPEPSEGVTKRAFILARSIAEEGAVVEAEIRDGIAPALPGVRDCYRTWIQRVEERFKPNGLPQRGGPPPDLWMVSDHPLYVDRTGRVWHVGRRDGDGKRRRPRAWLAAYDPHAARRLESCADAALWSARFPAHEGRSRVTVRLSYSRAPLAAEDIARGKEAKHTK